MPCPSLHSPGVGLIPDSDIERIRSGADVVVLIGETVALKRAGRNWKGLCPFHGEKTPSFTVNPDKQIYHCFGCGEGGDVFRYFMKHSGISFVEAVERLADRLGIQLSNISEGGEDLQKRRSEREAAYQLNRLAARFFTHCLLDPKLGERGRKYLAARGIDLKTAEACGLGYAPADGQNLLRFLQGQKASQALALTLGLMRQNERGAYDFFRDRLTFSICSSDGKTLGFSGRALEDAQQPKYLNSPDSLIYNKSESLLGMQVAPEAVRQEKQVVLVEGNVDWLRLVQTGLRHVVAPLGTALTERQIRLLARWTDQFVLLFDGDSAGIKAADRALELFLPLGIIPKVVLLPEGEDPDTFVLKQGIEPLRQSITQARYLLDVMVERLLKRGSLPERAQGIERLGSLLAKLPGNVEKTMYIQRLADNFGLPEKVLWEAVQKPSNFSGQRADEGGTALRPDRQASKLPPLEKALVEVLFTGQVNGGLLLKEIEAEAFAHPLLRQIWQRCRRQFEAQGKLEVASLLSGIEEDEVRQLASRLAISAESWMPGGEKMVEDCLRQFRTVKMKEELKKLSGEIRDAEGQRNESQLQQLMERKNQLLRTIGTTVH